VSDDNLIRAVGFDLYGVMTASPYADMEAYATGEGVPAGVLTVKFSGRRWLEDVQRGAVSVSAYVDEVRTDLRDVYRVELDGDVLERLLDVAATPVPAVVDVVREVRETCRVGLLTNNLRDSQLWSPALNEDMFDVIIDASSGIRKPHPAAYSALVDAFGVLPSEVAFVDDSASNLQPAQGIGLRTVLFRDAEQCRGELRGLGVSLAPATA
jgi:putative hydrolase of the HAD superfamily